MKECVCVRLDVCAYACVVRVVQCQRTERERWVLARRRRGACSGSALSPLTLSIVQSNIMHPLVDPIKRRVTRSQAKKYDEGRREPATAALTFVSFSRGMRVRVVAAITNQWKAGYVGKTGSIDSRGWTDNVGVYTVQWDHLGGHCGFWAWEHCELERES